MYDTRDMMYLDYLKVKITKFHLTEHVNRYVCTDPSANT